MSRLLRSSAFRRAPSAGGAHDSSFLPAPAAPGRREGSISRRTLSAVSSGGAQGVTFLRPPSASGEVEGAAVRHGLALPTVPPRRHFSSLGSTLPPNGAPANISPAQIERLQRQIQELDDLVQQNVDDFLELYKEMRTGDRGYFERFLTKCGIPRSKSRDDFIWSSKVATVFVASGVVAYLLPEA